MPRDCPTCCRQYPSEANFCAICGRTLVLAVAPPGGRGVMLVLGCVISAAITYGVFAATGSAGPIENRRIELPGAKATALYNLLRPDGIRVVVGRQGGRLDIRGTAGECGTVTAFAEIITRCAGKPADQINHCMAHHRELWSTRQTYRLSSHMARVLFDALSPNDVPVLVSQDGKRVSVSASGADQETVRRFVEILRGRRL